MKKRVMLILSCLLLSVGFITAQTTRISGVVVDQNGEGVIGASVVVKGTTVGTATDIDGNYSLNVPEGKNTLVFSLVGMKSIERRAAANMRIVMEEDSQVLDAVVVTAMGITREKKALGYASQGVNSENLVQASNSDLSGALQGKVSGVQITPSSGMPGSSSQIKIRGARSFTGDNTPLYVIDGMPVSSAADMNTNNSTSGTDYANRAVDIDPSNIESIEILKGQSASALYGIRASNGVVIITTKSGKNIKKGKPQITISSSISFDKISRYPEIQKTYAQGTYSSKTGTNLYNPSTSLSWGPEISKLADDPNYGGNTDNQYTQKYGKQPGKYYVPQRSETGLDPWATPQAYDNARDFFNTGTTWNTSVGVAQALDRSSYSVFLGSSNQEGIVPTTGMDRYTAKIGAETKLSDHFTSGFVGTYVKNSIKKAPGANDGLVATVFNAPASYDLAGIPYHADKNPYKQVNYRSSGFTNPYWNTVNNKFSETTSRFYGNLFVNYNTKFNTIDKQLNVKYQIGVDAYTTNYTDSWGYGNKGQSKNGQIENESRKKINLNSLLTANFQWKIDSDWTLTAVLGNEIIQESKINNYQYGSSYDFSGWNQIGNATNLINSSKRYQKRTIGFFGDVTASFKNMLYLGITGREDIVSNMPRNNRSFFYPSVNASFVYTELIPDRKILDFGKIRMSYAEVGQAGDYLENYYYKPEYGGGFYNGTPIQYPINGSNAYIPYFKIYDPNLKPQNTRSYEIGLDATLLSGLFDISYTYSRQNVKDQIFDIPLAGSTGFRKMVSNGGKIHTNTHEINVNINPVRTDLIDWSFGANWSKIDNYVDELADGVPSIMLGGYVTPQVRAGVGDKFPVIYGKDFKRDEKTGHILVDENGLPQAGEDAVIGSVSPNFILGFNTTIRISKLRIAAVFDWKSGGQMYHGSKGLMDFYGVSKNTENREDKIFDGWKADGTKNDIKVSAQSYYSALNNIDASSVYNNSFVKLRELSLAYPVYQSSWLEVGVNVFARNIIVWSELSDFDPEASQGNNNMAGAFERFSLPNTSSYGFGVNVKF